MLDTSNAKPIHAPSAKLPESVNVGIHLRIIRRQELNMEQAVQRSVGELMNHTNPSVNRPTVKVYDHNHRKE